MIVDKIDFDQKRVKKLNKNSSLRDIVYALFIGVISQKNICR